MEKQDDLGDDQPRTRLERYKYTPLPDPNTHIRLLQLSPVKDDLDLISGELTHVALDDAPPFVALSYTWGPKTPVIPILLDRSLFGVQQNLFSFLWHYVRTGRKDRLWIDALTINQQNPAEKGSQVNLMARIFESADVTVIWLGDPCGFDYTVRLWTLQEFVLARRLMIQHGVYWADWEAFKDWRLPQNHEARDHNGVTASRTSEFRSQLSRFDPLQMQREAWQRTSSSQRRGTNLLDLVASNDQRGCMDARDRVYGLLGLANSEIANIKPDYQLSAADLFFKVLERADALVSKEYCRSWKPLWKALELDRSDSINDPYRSRPLPGEGQIFMHAHVVEKMHDALPHLCLKGGMVDNKNEMEAVEHLFLPVRRAAQKSFYSVQVAVPALTETTGVLYRLDAFNFLSFILKDRPIQDESFIYDAKDVPATKDLHDLATGAVAWRLIEDGYKTDRRMSSVQPPQDHLFELSKYGRFDMEMATRQVLMLSMTKRLGCFDLDGILIMDTSSRQCSNAGQSSVVISMPCSKFARCQAIAESLPKAFDQITDATASTRPRLAFRLPPGTINRKLFFDSQGPS